MPESNPFEAPREERVVPRFAVVIPAATYRALSPERRLAVAALAHVPAERLEMVMQSKLPIVLCLSPDRLNTARANTLIKDVVALPSKVAAPPSWAAVVVFLLFGLSVAGAADTIQALAIGAAIVVASVWWFLGAWRLFKAIPAAAAAIGRPTPPSDPIQAARALANTGHPLEGCALLVGVAIQDTWESEPWVQALQEAAAISQASGRVVAARKCLQRVTKARPGDARTKMALAASMVQAPQEPSAAATAADSPGSHEPPWRYQNAVAVPTTGPTTWPRVCPLCNAPARDSVRIDIAHEDHVWLPFVGLWLRPFIALATRRSAQSIVFLCATHRRRLLVARGVALTMPLLILISAVFGVWSGNLAAILVSIASMPIWFIALAWRNPFDTRHANRAMFVVSGACPAFVNSLPAPPTDVVLSP